MHTISSKKTPLGLGATAGFGLAVVAVFVLTQVLVAIGFIAVTVAMNPDLGVDALTDGLSSNGLFLSLATCTTAPVCIGLIILIIRLRKRSPVKHYLGLNPVAPKTMIQWVGITILFSLTSDGLTKLLGRPIVPEFVAAAYETASFVPLLWFALIVAAPLFEEVFFRGFLFKGFQHSRLGSLGAILLTSFVWAIIHVQYDAYELSTIFVLGIIFGVARLKTRSIYTTLVMHSAFNLLALIQVAVYIGSP